jgi:hypothetical protein
MACASIYKITNLQVNAITVGGQLLQELASACAQAYEQCMLVFDIWVVRLNLYSCVLFPLDLELLDSSNVMKNSP